MFAHQGVEAFSGGRRDAHRALEALGQDGGVLRAVRLVDDEELGTAAAPISSKTV